MKANTKPLKTFWRTIPNYSRYVASNTGLIKTFDWKGSGKEKILSPALDQSGYFRTMLKRDDGKTHTVKIHRIIAQTFIPNTENKAEVNHKNGNKTDNNINNLEWVTHQENVQHAFALGLAKPRRGEKNNKSILTEKQVIEIRKKFYPRKYTRLMLAKEYGVSPATIKDVILRRSWKYV